MRLPARVPRLVRSAVLRVGNLSVVAAAVVATDSVRPGTDNAAPGPGGNTSFLEATPTLLTLYRMGLTADFR